MFKCAQVSCRRETSSGFSISVHDCLSSLGDRRHQRDKTGLPVHLADGNGALAALAAGEASCALLCALVISAQRALGLAHFGASAAFAPGLGGGVFVLPCAGRCGLGLVSFLYSVYDVLTWGYYFVL